MQVMLTKGKVIRCSISKVFIFFLEMEITVNNEVKKIQDDSLQSLITHILGDKIKGVAIAVNNNVIPRADWSNAKLKEKDDVMIIKATQGG
jgi:sulfur carrier protein